MQKALHLSGEELQLAQFLFSVVGPLCGTRCTTPGPQDVLGLGCEAASGFQRVGDDWMGSPLFLYGCGASASRTWKK